MKDAAAYFERPIPIALVLGVFVLGVVPLALLQLVPNYFGVVPFLTLLVAVGLGTTHFFLTLAVYLAPGHLQYFASTRRRALIYFGVPALIFVLLAWIASSGVQGTHPAQVALFFAFVRMLDFFHVGRQSFGILQLWKRPLGAAAPPWMRSTENVFFVGAAAMQWQTFWVGGSFPAERMEGMLPAAALGVVFVVIASEYARQLIAGNRAAALPLVYFTVQAICSAAAVYRTWLYLTVLAVHYLEYHVIMYPRCFGAAPDAAKERGVLSWLRRNPLVFYGALVLVVVGFEFRNSVQLDSRSLMFLIHIFDGIFVTHYVLDAFLWRFGNPFYREHLGRLYFQPAAPSAEPRRKSWVVALIATALAAVTTLAFTSYRTEGTQTLGGSIANPIHAKNHLRWGVELAQRGDFPRAREHLNEALARDPNSRDAQNALRWVETRLTTAAVDRP